MSGYRILEENGYVDIVMADVVISQHLAEKMTRHGQPLITKAQFYAKKNGQCFELIVEKFRRNRTSNASPIVQIDSVKQVALAEYEKARVKFGNCYNHEIW